MQVHSNYLRSLSEQHMAIDLETDAERMSQLLRGKAVRVVQRHRTIEVLLQFEDGTRLFVNAIADRLDFSITEARE
jgi:hypothetical protein